MKLVVRDLAQAPHVNQSALMPKGVINLKTAPYAIFLLRVSLGLLFLAHGLLKLFTFTLPGTAEFFSSVGLPGFMAYPVTFLEVFGGLALIVGFYSRWVAAALMPILLVATFQLHWVNGWLFTNENGGWEFPAFFGVATLVQFLLGDGAYALSTRFQRR